VKPVLESEQDAAVTGGPSAEEGRPLAGYGLLAGVFVALSSAGAAAAKRSGKQLPDAYRPWDLLLVGGATHKASRMIAKDKVTAALRAPFTEYQGPGAPGEVEEKARGSGLRLAIGELLVCPYCLGVWIATALSFGLTVAPRATRFVSFLLSAVGIADFLQIAYKASDERA
jgi:hypothetical protein